MIDTHAHLLCFEDLNNVINSMEQDGLEKIVTIGTTLEDSKQSINLASKYKNVYCSVGIYPEYAEGITEKDLNELEDLAYNKKVVAIGEIGLDYHNGDSDKEIQKQVFVKQLEIADRLGIPFCIHCRSAADDVINVLKENKHLIKHSGVMHCYSEGAKYIKEFLNLGLYISFSGNITFKKSDRSFLKDIPLDKILIETDAPYLSPEPLRGRRNYPKNVLLTAKRIAQELNISFEEFDKITTKNAKNLYFKMR